MYDTTISILRYDSTMYAKDIISFKFKGSVGSHAFLEKKFLLAVVLRKDVPGGALDSTARASTPRTRGGPIQGTIKLEIH
jgi:hypothetical protein